MKKSKCKCNVKDYLYVIVAYWFSGDALCANYDATCYCFLSSYIFISGIAECLYVMSPHPSHAWVNRLTSYQ